MLTLNPIDILHLKSVLLCDAVTGRASHVRRLATESGDKFRQIVDKAIEMTKGCNCSPSCLLGNVSDGYSTVHLKAVNKSDTYILAGVLQFTINVDCSAPAVFIYGCTTLRNDFQEASMLHGGLP